MSAVWVSASGDQDPASARTVLRNVAGRGDVECVLVVAASTGGPRALTALLAHLPSDLPAAVLIVQHLPSGFTRSLAERLDQSSPLGVAEATDGAWLVNGRALVAPGDFHLLLSGCQVALDGGPRRHGVRPAADATLESVSSSFGARVLAVILTGMGTDGVEGARAVRSAGGRVLAEAEETCVIFGMPRAVAEAGLAHRIVPLYAMPEAISQELALLSGRSPGARGA